MVKERLKDSENCEGVCLPDDKLLLYVLDGFMTEADSSSTGNNS